MVDRFETDLSPFKPGGLFANPDGTLTGDGYRFLDQLWKRSGGFQDAGWDISAISESLQTQIGDLNTKLDGLLADNRFADDSSVLDLLQRVEALEARADDPGGETPLLDMLQRLEALEARADDPGGETPLLDMLQRLEALEVGVADTTEISESALRQALNIEDKNVITGGLKTRGLATNAVSAFTFNSAASSAITTTNPKRTNSNTVTLDVDLDEGYVPGGDIAILVDFEHAVDSQAFNWCVMSLELQRFALGPTGSPTSIRRSLWVAPGDAGNTYLPNSINNETITFPHNWIYTETLPGINDAAYNRAGYTYRAKIEVATDWDDGSTMIDGYDTPGTSAKHHRIEDWQILLLHLKR